MAGCGRTVAASAETQAQTTQTSVPSGSQDARNSAGETSNADAGLPTANQRAGLTPYEPGPNVAALPPADQKPVLPSNPPAAPAPPEQPAVACCRASS